MLKLIGIIYFRFTPISEYYCSEGEPIRPGQLRHTWGFRVTDIYSASKYAWQYSKNKIERPGETITGEHTIYGPYINDFGKPGYYRIQFRLRAIGIPKDNEPIISLDVVQARFGTEAVLRLLGQKIIKGKELSEQYKKYNIICFASGTGVYEYRCAVMGIVNTIENSKILFESIKVYSHPSVWEIL